ncbi:MAG: MFS transporter [Candidatus Woesearchaeota archaeon]
MIKNHFSNFSENKRNAIILLLLFGIISLLGDIIYEGARSVNGPFLRTLGANAAILGFVVGVGELLGYAIRLVSGYFSDKTKAHWFFTILGYGLLISVPLLALSDYWQLAAVFLILERIGKGLRGPAKDTLVSHAAKQVGTGLGFGISEFLDQIGAVIGPLAFTFFFIYLGPAQKTVSEYQQGFALLWIPFILLLLVLFATFLKFRTPSKLEEAITKKKKSAGLSKVFWLYSLFAFFTAAGFISFAIMGYHLKTNRIVPDAQIPFFYAIAMIVDAVCGIIVGKMYDNLKLKHKNERAGLLVLLFMPIITAVLLPFAFSQNKAFIWIAVFLWGVVMGSHETIMKAAIADLTPITKRGTAYGIFNITYGLALFAGSFLAGYLYDISITLMISALVCIELMSIPLFFALKREIKNSKPIQK